MSNVVLHPSALNERVIRLEARVEQLQEIQHAQELIIGWLLSRRLPDDECPASSALHFLRTQRAEFLSSPKYAEDVALIESLIQHVEHWLALQAPRS